MALDDMQKAGWIHYVRTLITYILFRVLQIILTRVIKRITRSNVFKPSCSIRDSPSFLANDAN